MVSPEVLALSSVAPPLPGVLSQRGVNRWAAPLVSSSLSFIIVSVGLGHRRRQQRSPHPTFSVVLMVLNLHHRHPGRVPSLQCCPHSPQASPSLKSPQSFIIVIHEESPAFIIINESLAFVILEESPILIMVRAPIFCHLHP